MNIAELSIRRPVMTTLLMAGILLFGILAFIQLPVSDLPVVDFPVIQVSASLPGANPDTMAASVATPLEKQFSTIAGLMSMSSTSSLGRTSITLQFDLSRNIDAAAQDVNAAIGQAQRQLPSEMPSPPSYQKYNPSDQPILYIALTTKTLPMSTLDEYGETTMAQRISTVSGVAQVMVYGAQKYAVRVQIDPNVLAGRGIGLDEVSAAIQANNVNLPTGVLYGQSNAFTVQASGQLMQASEYLPMVVTYRKGSPVRLEELGRAIDSVENDKTVAWFFRNGKSDRAVVLAIQRQPGTNTIEVAQAVKKILPQLRSQIPRSVDVNLLYDRSVVIKESVDDVEFTLVLTLCLVVMVIFLFLRNVTATVIPSLALPMSVVGTFAFMYLLDYSLDNLSLMALTLAVGFVVDDAIVMLENIVRHTEMGKSRLQAALEGSREIFFTIISMTLSLAAVFIPVLFLGGIVGRLFREFAVTIGLAVLVSGFVSVTLTPMLSSRFLKPAAEVHHGHIYRVTEGIFNLLVGVYGRMLRVTLRHPVVTFLVSVGVLGATVYMFVVMPKGFLPNEDRNQIFGSTEAAQGISFESMALHQQAVASIMAADPNVDAMIATAGARGSNAGNTGILFARLKPRSERKLNADQVIEELRPKLARVPGIRVYLQNPPPIPVGTRVTKGVYQYTLQGSDTRELYRFAAQFEAALRTLPRLQDVNNDMQVSNPQVNVNILRDKASTYGITPVQIEDALYSAFGSRQVSTIYTPTNEYEVILELLPQYQLDPNALKRLYVRSPLNQNLVPLEAVAKLEMGVGPLLVNHTGQMPSATISFNLAPGVSLGDATNEVEELARKMLPDTITGGFQGTAQAFESAKKGLNMLLILAVVVIYMVLGILYESFIHPLTILTALPFAGLGALLTLWLFDVELSLYAYVGIIMLVGLVKKNGIMMIDFAIEAQRKENKPPREAIYQACIIRFRPIMMTTMAALMAGLPIAAGWGAGAEARRPLGLAVVGGLLFSQTLTLFVTPVFYVFFDRVQHIFSRSKTRPAEITPPQTERN